MALYPYLCDNCGEFDVIQKITENPMVICNTCGGPVKRQISSSGSFSIQGEGVFSPGTRGSGRGKEPKLKSNRIRIRPEDIKDE